MYRRVCGTQSCILDPYLPQNEYRSPKHIEGSHNSQTAPCPSHPAPMYLSKNDSASKPHCFSWYLRTQIPPFLRTRDYKPAFQYFVMWRQNFPYLRRNKGNISARSRSRLPNGRILQGGFEKGTTFAVRSTFSYKREPLLSMIRCKPWCQLTRLKVAISSRVSRWMCINIYPSEEDTYAMAAMSGPWSVTSPPFAKVFPLALSTG